MATIDSEFCRQPASIIAHDILSKTARLQTARQKLGAPGISAADAAALTTRDPGLERRHRHRRTVAAKDFLVGDIRSRHRCASIRRSSTLPSPTAWTDGQASARRIPSSSASCFWSDLSRPDYAGIQRHAACAHGRHERRLCRLQISREGLSARLPRQRAPQRSGHGLPPCPFHSPWTYRAASWSACARRALRRGGGSGLQLDLDLKGGDRARRAALTRTLSAMSTWREITSRISRENRDQIAGAGRDALVLQQDACRRSRATRAERDGRKKSKIVMPPSDRTACP